MDEWSSAIEEKREKENNSLSCLEKCNLMMRTLKNEKFPLDKQQL